MSHCGNCNTEFKFSDVLKAFNPASIQCSGCSERIKSGYIPLLAALALFAILCLAFWTAPLSSGPSGGVAKLAFLAVLGLIFEFGYFCALKKGVIKSNLTNLRGQA